MEVSLQAGKAVSSASVAQDGKFVLKVEKRTSDFVDYINANYVLVATGSSQQVWAFLFAPRFVSSPYHRAESYTLNILLTCRVIQLLHSSAIPLLHQCPACSHLKSQTSGWLISPGYASTEAVSIPMLRITLSSNKIVIICKSCSQIT